MQSSGEGEWLHRRFHSAVRGCFAAGLPDVAPRATFTSLRAEHWTRLGDVTPEDAYTLGKLERHSEGAREAAFQAHAELVWRAAVSRDASRMVAPASWRFVPQRHKPSRRDDGRTRRRFRHGRVGMVDQRRTARRSTSRSALHRRDGARRCAVLPMGDQAGDQALPPRCPALAARRNVDSFDGFGFGVNLADSERNVARCWRSRHSRSKRRHGRAATPRERGEAIRPQRASGGADASVCNTLLP